MEKTDIKTSVMEHLTGGTNRNSLLLVFILLSGMIVSGANGLESQKLCQKFTADKKVKNLINTKLKTVPPCACVEQQIILDYSFEKIGNCYRQWFFENGVKQMCCYSGNGHLEVGAPRGGYMILENDLLNMSFIHNICCIYNNKDMCSRFYSLNPSSECENYKVPATVTSWGDPVIQTIDGLEYDFNGHGEYVFLKTINFTIQARTDYISPDNKDATMFTSFAIYDKEYDQSIQLQLDRKTKDILIYWHGVNVCNASKEEFGPCKGARGKCRLLAGNGKVILQNCGISKFARAIEIQSGSTMAITITLTEKNVELQGLAGSLINGSLIGNNGTYCTNTSSPKDCFLFGESWRLKNESESVFNYTIGNRAFKYYNSNHTVPTFLEDYLNNLTLLFNQNGHKHNATDIANYKNLCKGYKECLLAIARTDDISLGKDAVQRIEHGLYIKALNSKHTFIL
ncbi:sushi domain-containing protein 2-like [Mercenaria mercenaria]|uniref:sushi domain-containing protein 2-like n=1 Tax=Mercenaria mercenaria TaxID=6596 RepID=UPI00234FAB3E|nr:sushi domain-containing protein 2-like [Mercenaria mercenaria]